MFFKKGEQVTSQREPIFSIPPVVVASVGLLMLIHVVRVMFLSLAQDEWILETFAFVPAQFTALFDADGVVKAISALPGALGIQPDEIAALVADNHLQIWTLLTYGLLHGDVMHLGVNCIWLVAFAAPVVRRIGGLRFLALCIATTLGGAALHLLARRYDVTPVIGASAAVSGIMAFASRFVFQPGAPLGSALGAAARDQDHAYQQPAMPLAQLFSQGRVLSFLVIWMVVNLVFGVLSQPLGMTQSPVAWEAHVGGFLVGLLLFQLFDRPSLQRDLQDLA